MKAWEAEEEYQAFLKSLFMDEELRKKYQTYFAKNARYDKGDGSPGSYDSYLVKVGEMICEASSPQVLAQLMVEQFEKQNLEP